MHCVISVKILMLHVTFDKIYIKKIICFYWNMNNIKRTFANNNNEVVQKVKNNCSHGFKEPCRTRRYWRRRDHRTVASHARMRTLVYKMTRQCVLSAPIINYNFFHLQNISYAFIRSVLWWNMSYRILP